MHFPSWESFFSPSPLSVGAAFIFNALVGILGMNRTSRWATNGFLVTGFILTAIAVVVSANQISESTDAQNENKNLSTLIKKIAVVQGIDVDQPSVPVAEKTLKKQIGEEAIELSEEIYRFVADSANSSKSDQISGNNTTSYFDIYANKKFMDIYERKFMSRSLSILDQARKADASDVGSDYESRFSSPNNRSGIEDVALMLARLGRNLKEESRN